MDHDEKQHSPFGMEDSAMSQGVDNLAVAAVNLNELTQTQGHFVSETENGRQPSSTSKAFFNNNEKNYEQDEKSLDTGQLDEDQDEVMREEEDDLEDSEESSLIRCQSPDTFMTDSSYSETGSLLETPYPVSPGTSPEPTSPVTGQEKKSSALDPTSSSEQFTSLEENVLDHKLTGASAMGAETLPQHSCVLPEVSQPLSHSSRSFSADGESVAALEPPLCTTDATANQEPSHLLGFLDQLAKRGDDTHLPHYLHQIAEAFVHREDYQRAICCIQLERLYHQRLLDNLSALQKQWEIQCNRTSPDLPVQHLDTLTHICLTHNRPKADDAVCASLDHLLVLSHCSGNMEQGTGDSSCESLLSPSIDPGEKTDSSEVTETDGKSDSTDSPHQALSNEEEGMESEGGLARTMLAEGNGVHPSVIGNMDQPKTAEQQGGGVCPAKEEPTDVEEEKDVEEATEALEMEEDEDADEDRDNGKAFTFCPETLPVETIVSAAEVESRLQESRPDETDTQLCPDDKQSGDKPGLPSETHLPEEDDMKYQGLFVKEEDEEEEYEYEVEPADLIRAAATLDDMAKLITVEEMSPTTGLVSILKKRSLQTESLTVSPEFQCSKPPAKRRVRFRVPDDGFEQDVGGGDSCLLLFLLCLVTVVISVGGTALYCALGDTHSSVCQDFSRNADFYIGQIQRGMSHIQQWIAPGS